MHQQTEFEPPTRAWAAKKFFSGLRRELGAAPNRKRPVLTDDLKQILAEIPDTAAGPSAVRHPRCEARIPAHWRCRQCRKAVPAARGWRPSVPSRNLRPPGSKREV